MGVSCRNITEDRVRRSNENMRTKNGSNEQKDKMKDKHNPKANEETTELNVS